MNLIDLVNLINSEGAADEYLRKIGILPTFRYCIYCRSESLGKVRRAKIKCYTCNREWYQRKGSILEGIRVDSKKILLLIKLIDYKFNNQKIQKELRMERRSVIKLRKLLKSLGGGYNRLVHFSLML